MLNGLVVVDTVTEFEGEERVGFLVTTTADLFETEVECETHFLVPDLL